MTDSYTRLMASHGSIPFPLEELRDLVLDFVRISYLQGVMDVTQCIIDVTQVFESENDPNKLPVKNMDDFMLVWGLRDFMKRPVEEGRAAHAQFAAKAQAST